MNELGLEQEQSDTLVKRLKQDEPGAFKELVERYRDRVINTCYRFLFNREDAEDTAQEVFIDVYNAISGFNETANISTWLYRIAVNRSIDLIRKYKRKKRFAPVKSLLGMEEKGQEVPAPIKNNPAEQLEQEERLKTLYQAIDTLPENQRICFTLSKCDGVGNKDIAQIMGVSLSSVESLMHRAKKNLRKKLFSYFEKDLKRKKELLIIFLLVLLASQRKFLIHFTSKWLD
ncbi:MAG: RNA polymerase sigma factor [bacterium]|nr:RNA polymerase sigma factor [bacterium]